MNIVDEFTRECLAIDVAHSIDADRVVAVLDKIAGERGYPTYLRFDIQDESALGSTPWPAGEERLRVTGARSSSLLSDRSVM